MTRWLALVLRLCAIYLVWCALVDIYSVYTTSRVTSIFNSFNGPTPIFPGSPEQEAPQGMNQIATFAYRWIAVSLFLHVMGAVILWIKCLAIARFITRDIDPDEPRR